MRSQKIFFVILRRNILVSYGRNHPRPKRTANFERRKLTYDFAKAGQIKMNRSEMAGT